MSPYERNMVGSVAGAGLKGEAPLVRETVVQDLGDAFGVAGVLERADGQFEQRFAFVALPDGRAVYADRVLVTSATRHAMTLRLGTIALANEPRWACHDGDRTIHHEGGHSNFGCRSGKSTATVTFPASAWFNVDDQLGIATVKCTGRPQYDPACDVRHGRVEQLFHANTVRIGPQETGSRSPVAETVLVFHPGKDRRETATVAAKCTLRNGTLTLDDGASLVIDLDALSVKNLPW